MNRDRAQCQRCVGLGVVQVIDDILRAGLADPFPAMSSAPCPVCGGKGWFGPVDPAPTKVMVEAQRELEGIQRRKEISAMRGERTKRFGRWVRERGQWIRRLPASRGGRSARRR